MNVRLSAPAVSTALMFSHVFWGAGYAFGPPRLTSSGSYRVALDWAAATVWGWLFLVGAAATVVAPHLPWWGSVVAHSLASLPLAGFATALIAAQVAGYSEGWGGPLAYLAAITFHAVLGLARVRGETVGE